MWGFCRADYLERYEARTAALKDIQENWRLMPTSVAGADIFPSDDRGFFPEDGKKADNGSPITPAMREASARNKQALYERF